MSDHEIKDEWVARLSNPESQPQALEDLRSILIRGLRKAFSGKGGGDAFCEDVAQETLIRVLAKIDQFAGRSRFTTWAMSIAVRIGTSQFRKKMFKDVSINIVDSDDNMKFDFADESTEAPEKTQDRATLIDTLRELIKDSLTDKQKHATDAILHGMPVEEIATRSSSNRNAIYKLIHDARMRLRNGLEKAGYSADDVLSLIS